jgi:hypothetical protein
MYETDPFFEKLHSEKSNHYVSSTTRRLVETGIAAVPDYLVGFDYATG